MPRGRRNRVPVHEESDDSNDDEAPPTQQHPSNDDDDDDEENHPGASLTHDDDCAAIRATPANAPDENTLRVLLSTDNHLGYLERDPIRGNDSFAALEEVLSIARSNHVDLVLLSGDVFHENKPSRRTLHATMEILRRYCMGGESVGFQIVSDQGECLRSVVTGRANYEDEYYSVDLPIFAIHGNHDDPTRDGGTEMLSALDLLSVSNLINYFGRQDQVDNVQVSPVLLQKGETKVALYGMGSMRDERLNRMWQGKKVRFLRPEEDTDQSRHRRNNEDGEEDDDENGPSNSSSWFNIFTLHQNRDLGRGSKNCVHESMIPEWMDLVVWGHEHECLINPAESLVGTFRITQPGSSVATSLTMGEARRKHVGILDIRGQQFRLKPVPLGSVRSFTIGDASLSDWVRDGKLDREDPKVEERMSDLLAEEVEKLIQRAREDAELLRQDLEAQAQANIDIEDEFDPDKRVRKYTLQYPGQVLVRLKVEHSGFTTLNNQRFGSRFVGEVANPSDILLFHKKRQAENATTKGGAAKKKQTKSLNTPSEPEELEEINVEDLVNDNLFNSDKKLELLNEKDMAEALDDFVAKELKQAIGDKTSQCLKASQKILKNRGKKQGDDEEVTADNPTAIREFCLSKSEKIRAELALEREEAAERKKKKELDKSRQIIEELNSPGNNAKSQHHDDSSDEEDAYRPATNKPKPDTTSKKSTTKSRKNVYDDSDDDVEEDSPPLKKRNTATKAKAATTSKKSPRKRTITHADSSDDEVEFAGTSQTTAKRAPRTARSTAKKSKYSYHDSDIEEIDDDGEELPPPKKQATKKASSQSQATITTFTSARKPAGRGRSTVKRNYLDVESDDDDDEPQNKGRGGWGIATSQNTAAKRGRR
eukprot:CCRYP_003783-RB/>CCRYP_003783-RB protein AED:0.15 eAED:0.15 QI:266/1/1/1/1/0.8/5/1732/878